MARGLEYGAGVDWRLRSGLVLSPGLTYSRVDAAGAEAIAQNTGAASLGVLLPLLRGRGGGALTASERAAATGLDASRADLAQVRAGSVLNAVNAYWGYLAAVRTVEVLRQAEERAGVLLRQTVTLIEADERPAVDRLPVAANLASKRASRLSAESSVSAARQSLAQAMGLAPERLASLPPPADAFPATPDSTVATTADPAAWVAQALARRADLAAARRRREAAGTLLQGARAETRARLDLNLTLGYTGIATGQAVDRLFTPFYAPDRGVHAQLGFSYGVPLGNNAAAGELLRGTAADRQSAIALDELARTIALSVATAAETLARTVEELRLSDEAVRLHTLSVESESQKFRLGTSTLFDVIQAEDGLTGATLSLIDTQRRYASSLATLRFETGALVGGPEGGDVDFAGLASWTAGAAR
jgi:outer membrane protein TolC